MNTKSVLLGSIALLGLPLWGNAASTESKPLRYEVGERGANHRAWNKVVSQTNQSGGVTLSTNLAYVEIAAGLHYQNAQGRFLDSKEEFTLVPGWAVARKGQHKVSLAYNLNTAGPVATELPDGRITRSQVLSLHYLDKTTGRSVRIAEIKNCVGVVIAPNQVLYTNAFSGVNADVRFTYTKSGIEQDVILRTQPPSPASLGLNPATTRLAVLTEFLNPPSHTIRQVDTDADSVDEEVEFGSMHIGRGRAFAQVTNSVDRALQRQTQVKKRWMQSNGRTFLLEQVPLADVSEDLDKLPKQAALSPRETETLMAGVPGSAGTPAGELLASADGTPAGESFASKAGKGAGAPRGAGAPMTDAQLEATLEIPEPRTAGQWPVPADDLAAGDFDGKLPSNTGQWPVPPMAPMMEIAQVWREPAGFVLDYQQLNSSLTNFTFQSNMTYYASGRVDLWGTTTFEGGAVIKCAPVDGLLLVISDSSKSYVWCKSTPAKPVVFTSSNDDSIGEIISGSTNNPVISPLNNFYLTLWALSGMDVHDIRMLYGFHPLWVFGSSGVLSNIQLGHSRYPFWGMGANVRLRNILIHDTTMVAFWLHNSTLSIEQMTVDQCFILSENESQSVMALTNSLLIGVQNLGSVPLTTNSVAMAGTNTPVFQAVGLGSHYLLPGSAYRDVGTTGIDPVLLYYLQQMTTYPPPESYADANAVDLGFHYPRQTDWDNDGLEDGWELNYFGNLNQTGSGDFDGDGVSNLIEFLQGRNPAAGAALDVNGATALKTFTPLK